MYIDRVVFARVRKSCVPDFLVRSSPYTLILYRRVISSIKYG